MKVIKFGKFASLSVKIVSSPKIDDTPQKIKPGDKGQKEKRRVGRRFLRRKFQGEVGGSKNKNKGGNYKKIKRNNDYGEAKKVGDKNCQIATQKAQ